jgi:membrane-associated phospholipid phosphatase
MNCLISSHGCLYGVIHFSLPFIFSFVLFIYGPPGSLNLFGQAFGWMNFAGVLTQLAFPNASPWYEMSFGSAPANYSFPGEAGGLARIDKILGLKLYSTSFGASPLVFGAFPSLHSASATVEMLFITYRWRKFWPAGVAYTMLLWWSTMYLTHHYLIDLVGGSIYALIAYFIASVYLPPVDPTKKTRLQYLGQPFSIRALFLSIERDQRNESDSRGTTIAVEPKDEEEGLLPDEDRPSVPSSASPARSSVSERIWPK